MARIRTIKPELWTDPEFTECSLMARLLFIASWNFATDYGVLPDKPRQLKMQCLPAESVDAEPLIQELVDRDFLIRRVAPNGDKVLCIRTFFKNQKINRATKGRWGDPADWSYPQGDSLRTHGGLTESHPSDTEGDNSDCSDSSDALDNSDRLPTGSTGGELDAETKKKCNVVTAYIVHHRIEQLDKQVGPEYVAKVRADVLTTHTQRIIDLCIRFPNAPIDMIAHGIETGDTRRLNHYAEQPDPEPTPDEPKLTPDQIQATINAAKGAA